VTEATVEVATTPRRARREGRTALFLIVPAVVVVVGVVGWPLVTTVLNSFRRVESALPKAPKPFVGLHNYAYILSDSDFWNAVRNTLYFTFFNTGLELVLGVGLGVLMFQPMRGRWLLRVAVILPWALPTVVNAAMWRYYMNADYGPLNAFLVQTGIRQDYYSFLGSGTSAMNSVILVDVWKNTSLVAFFVLAGLQVIPKELYESAEIDGAGALRRFWSITLPLLRPVLAVVLVLRTIEAFKVFDVIYVMTRGGPASSTTSLALYAYKTAFSDQLFGIGSAISLVIVLFCLSLSLFYIRALGGSMGPEQS